LRAVGADSAVTADDRATLLMENSEPRHLDHEIHPSYMKRNPAESRAALETALRESLEAAENVECCDCGEPVWVLGSAIVGRGCFTPITGESTPSGDYEITAVR
jgi:hypothetical protein